MKNTITLKKLKADYVGIIGSTLCALHCALTPFVLTAISAVKTTEEGWAWLDYAFIALCLWAMPKF